MTRGLSTDGERELLGEDVRDLLLGVVMRRGDGVGFKGDEFVITVSVVTEGNSSPGPRSGVEVFDADEPAGRVRRLK